jgi:hypothetical protein
MARRRTRAQREQALRLYEKHGAAEAARRTGIARATIERWAKVEGRPKEEAVGPKHHEWKDKESPEAGPAGGAYTAEERERAITLCMKHGPVGAARRTGIPRATILGWASAERLLVGVPRHRGDKQPPQAGRAYTSEQREWALRLVINYGLAEAARRTGIPSTMIVAWWRGWRQGRTGPRRTAKVYVGWEGSRDWDARPVSETVDYAMVLDEDGAACGMWLANAKDARERRGKSAPIIETLLRENDVADLIGVPRRVVPNNYDDNGGCFVMFGHALAPGE